MMMNKIYFMQQSAKIEDLLDNYKYSKPASLIELLQDKYYHLMLLGSIITFTTFVMYGQNDPNFIDIQLATIFLIFGFLWRYFKKNPKEGLVERVFNRVQESRKNPNLFNPEDIKKLLADLRLYGAEYPDVMAYCKDIEDTYRKIKLEKEGYQVEYNRIKLIAYGVVIAACVILGMI